jgi:tape measure domain-containing protein
VAGTKLDSLFYEIDVRTEKLDAGVARAKQRVRELASESTPTIAPKVDSKPAEAGLERVSRSAKKAMSEVEKASADATKRARENARELGDGFSQSALGVGIATASIVGLGAALLKMADNYDLVAGRLKLVTSSSGQLALVQEELLNIANRSFQAYGSTADLYARLARSAKSLGLEQQELFDITEATALAVRLSGASAEGAKAGLVQLGQGFASGTLRGEELNSVLEQLPRVAEAIATGLGITVGELRKFGAEGKLTGEAVANALGSQLGTLTEEAARVPATLGQSLTVFQNSVGQYVAETNNAIGATRGLGAVVKGAADNFELVANAATAAAIVYASKGLTPLIVKGGEAVAVEIAKARATLAGAAAARVAAGAAATQAGAVGAVTAASAAGAVAVRAFNAAVGFLGGPVGAAITVALGAIAFAIDRVRDANREAAETAAEAQKALEKLTEAGARAKAGQLEGRRVDILTKDLPGAAGDPRKSDALLAELAALDGQIKDMIARANTLGAVAKQAADVGLVELGKEAENARGKLAAFNKGGETAASAFEKASAAWKDAGTGTRTFGEALAQGDVRAKQYLATAQELVGATNAITTAQDRARASKKVLEEAAKEYERQEKAFVEAMDRASDALDRRLALQNRPPSLDSQEKQVEALEKERTALLLGAKAYEAYLVRKREQEAIDKALSDAILQRGALTDGERDKVIALARETAALNEENTKLREGLGKKPASGASPVDEARQLTDALGGALGAAQGVAAAFGGIGKAIADAVGDAQNLVSAVERASKAGNTKGGDKGFLGALGGKAGVGGVLSAASGGLAIFGAVAGLADSLDLFGNKAKQRQRELERLADEFNAGLARFGRGISERNISGAGRARNSLADEVAQQVSMAAKAANVDPAVFEGVRATAEGLRAYQAQLRQLAGGKFDKESLALKRFASSLDGVIAAAEAGEAALRAEQAARLEEANESLRVRQLRAQGRTEEADALARELAVAKEIAAAEAEFEGADGLLDYLRTLREVSEAEAEAAAAATANAKALAFLNDRARLFGVEGAAYLTEFVNVLAGQMPQLAGLLDGIDITAAGGIDKLRERLQGIFTTLAADGITGEEQKIIDALLSILGAAEEAAGAVESFADRVGNALSSVAQDNDILGGDAATRFGRLANAASGLSAEIGAILGSVDLSTTAGAEEARGKLRDLYATLLVDGVTESEQAIINLIRDILGGIDEVVAEAGETAAGVVERSRNRSAEIIAAFDLEGADAFAETLNGYGEGFKNLFGVFDVGTVDGVNGAKEALRSLLTSVQNGTADLSAFGGLTRDEIIAVLLNLDGTLDTLADSAADVTAALLEQAQAGVDFVQDLNIEFLNATGMGLEAVKIQTRLWVAGMIKQAEALGVATEEVIAQINAIGDARIDAAEERDAGSAAGAAPAQTSFVRGDSAGGVVREESLPAAIDGEITAQRVSTITAASALNITDLLAASLVEQRAFRVAGERVAALLASMAGGPLALSVPALPPGASGGAGGGSLVQVVVNVSGPITGQSPADAGRQMAAELLPALNEALARAAGVEARLAGTPLS